jgi:hypothetical protein
MCRRWAGGRATGTVTGNMVLDRQKRNAREGQVPVTNQEGQVSKSGFVIVVVVVISRTSSVDVSSFDDCLMGKQCDTMRRTAQAFAQSGMYV